MKAVKNIVDKIKDKAEKFKAIQLFEDFHGRKPSVNEIGSVILEQPEITLEVGELYGVMYKVTGIKEPYLHRFTASKRPKLFVSADGKQIYIIGGNYKFTDRGFIG